MQKDDHASELGRWRTEQRSADPRLRPFVKGYFASSSVLPKPVRERHLPSTEIPLILNFGAPHRRLGAGAQDWDCRDGAWIVGLHERHQLAEASGAREFMVVRLTPLGAHRLFRTPMHLIAGQAVELSAMDPKLASLAMSRVSAARLWSERFDAMEALIAERVAGASPPTPVAWTWRQLEAAGGRLSLGSLLSELQCSHRSLIAQFRTEIGLPPKTVGRLFRFNRALRSLNALATGRAGQPEGKPYVEAGTSADRRPPMVRWADLAADCGYFDQSHFIKEFRQFAGHAPAGFLARMSDVC